MVKCDSARTPEGLVLTIRGHADLSHVVTLREQLLAAHVPGCPVVVSLEDVDTLDGAGIQLLLAYRATVGRDGGTFRLVADAEVAGRALALAAAAGALGA
ncbi:MAG: hypothetical protein JWP97_1715 [Labilithrix sp.]|nr:hypothetical protein [Labilithrix sp.]